MLMTVLAMQEKEVEEDTAERSLPQFQLRTQTHRCAVELCAMSDFCWRLRPMDKRVNEQMIAELVQNDIKENNGGFPEKKLFIERI